MTDPEIVRWLAEKVCGWRKPDGCYAWYKGDILAFNEDFEPLIDPRATGQVMEALRAKGYGFMIRHPASATSWHTAEVWHDEIIHWKVERDWKRAFCLAAVKATGGEV